MTLPATIKNVSNSPLNEDQQTAAEEIFHFLLTDEKEFSISGPAGTGKTFLMKHVISVLLQQYKNACKLVGIDPIDYEIALTATTNKAAEVLHLATGMETKTIHSFMNLAVRDNYQTGQTDLHMTGAWKVHNKKLIFIDEASMVDEKLYKFLHLGTDNTCKIIYLGDHCQMAPVMEEVSPVYRNQKNMAVLKTPMRNAGQPALMSLCEQLRETVETHKFFPMVEVPGVIDYMTGPQAEAWINQAFKTEQDQAIILAYSNARVMEYLTHIRSLRGYPNHPMIGEVLINNTALNYGNGGTILRAEEAVVVERCIGPESIPVYPDSSKNHGNMDVFTLQLEPTGATVKIPADLDDHKRLMRYFAKMKAWHVFYYLKNNFADLRPRDAATVYKAQGSTYDTVFVDLGNIGKCTQIDQLTRMLYVAVSRARNRVIFFGSLPSRLS